MRTNWIPTALILAAAAAAWAAPDGGAAPPPASKDAAAAEYIKELQPKLGKQSDQEAKDSIKKLVEFWKDKEVADATKKPAPDILGRYAREEKSAVATDALDALGECGAVGAQPVLEALDKTLKAKEPSTDVYKHAFDALKKMADPKPSTTKALTDYLKNKTDEVVGKAAEAMGGYANAPGKVRKTLFEELVKQTEGVSSSAKSAKNAPQVHKWQIIGGAVVGTLNALSKEQFKDPEDARKWFEKHKDDKMWDT
jgi:hypothetical protein